MPKINEFRVLVLDDSARVITRISNRIVGSRAPGQLDPAVPVQVSCVQVALRRQGDNQQNGLEVWTFDENMLGKLTTACPKPPHLILVDYRFADSSVLKVFREEAQTREITEAELVGKVLTPLDLAIWIRTDPDISEHTRKLLIRNLFESGVPVYLYAYTSREFIRAIGPMDERAQKTAQAFPRSIIVPIDTRRELYNEDEFDWPNPLSKYDPEFYTYQTSVLLDYVVHKEVLRTLLEDAKYLRISRLAGAVALVTVTGSAIGFAGQWIGSLVGELVKADHLFQAIAVGISLVLVLFFLGFSVPLAFERVMTHLLGKER